jgi:hypothetical protein
MPPRRIGSRCACNDRRIRDLEIEIGVLRAVGEQHLKDITRLTKERDEARELNLAFERVEDAAMAAWNGISGSSRTGDELARWIGDVLRPIIMSFPHLQFTEGSRRK